MHIYRPQRSWGQSKMKSLQASVILLTGGGAILGPGGSDEKGGSAPGGYLLWGVPAPDGGCLLLGGACYPGGGWGCLVETPLGRPLLLREIPILFGMHSCINIAEYLHHSTNGVFKFNLKDES